MAKALGSDIVAFFNSDWKEDWYVEDGPLDVVGDKIIRESDSDSALSLPLTEKYDLNDFGALCSFGSEPPTLSSFFNRWRKEQTTTTLIVEVDKTEEESVRKLFKLITGVKKIID